MEVVRGCGQLATLDRYANGCDCMNWWNHRIDAW